MKTIWLGNMWSSKEDMIRDFEDYDLDIEDPKVCKKYDNINILLAYYDIDGYEGQAFVLFRDLDNNLFTVEGSHCSCYGLEGQWDPVETSLEALKLSLNSGSLGLDYDDRSLFANELRFIVDQLS